MEESPIEFTFVELDNDTISMSSGDRKTRRARKVDANWPAERCHQLILLVEEKPNLWDVRNKDYKNRSKREISWEEIGQCINLPKEEVANKWNLLRQQFRNAYRKMQAKSDPAAADQKPPNQFYNALLFLQPVLDMDTGPRTSNYIMSEDSEASISSFDNTIEENEDFSPIVFSSPSPPSNSSSGNKLKQNQATMKRRKLAEMSTHRNTLMKTACGYLVNTKEEDEFELWGKSVAATLRNYPNAMAVRMAKSKMNQIMASLEAGELDCPIIKSFVNEY